ncbi:MAG: 30S ribosome-binding factor RbfA [Acidobacteria bacterium]|jgi:ribosome-binding factor A|nr:30S ribosome-binding factor RbfA [Acidobacteriota bacterium]
MPYRLQKFARTLQQALGEILGRESLDPGLQQVTVLRVQPAADLKRATVFIACPAGAEEAALAHLASAAGFIKKQLGRKMILRFMPELDFALDKAPDIERALDRLHPPTGHEKTDR